VSYLLAHTILCAFHVSLFHVSIFLFFSPENRSVYAIMFENTEQADRTQNTVRRMRIACWLPKDTYTQTLYVVLIAFPLEQRLHERTSMLRYPFIACLFSCMHLNVTYTMF
jgi:hypothetical protein